MPDLLHLDGVALTPTQGKLKRTAERVSKEVLAKNAAEVDRTGQFPEEGIQALKDSGLLSIMVPEDMGGPPDNGLPTVAAAHVTVALARGCASTAIAYAMHQSGVLLLCALARENDEQRGLFVDPILRGERFGGFAMSEKGSGNRIWHMDSHAVEYNGGFKLDTFKSFATSSGHCDYYVVPLRANDDVGPTDLSLFVVDGADPRIEPKGEWDGMGLRGNASRPVHFNGCEVPRINRLGPPTDGFAYMMAYTLPIYVISLAASYVGIAQNAYNAAVEHVKQRYHSDTGKALASLETVKRYAGEMRAAIDQTYAQLLRVAQKSDNARPLFDEYAEAEILREFIDENPDDPFFIELASLKINACECAVKVSNWALQVCGGVAYKRGHTAERCYRDARAGSLMAPSDDTLKIIIGNQVLGDKQPWA